MKYLILAIFLLTGCQWDSECQQKVDKAEDKVMSHYKWQVDAHSRKIVNLERSICILEAKLFEPKVGEEYFVWSFGELYTRRLVRIGGKYALVGKFGEDSLMGLVDSLEEVRIYMKKWDYLSKDCRLLDILNYGGF